MESVPSQAGSVADAQPAAADDPPGAVESAEGPAAPIDRQALREKVRELATISGDVEMLTRQLARPHSTVQVGLLRERMDQLMRTQRQLVLHIAGQCPDPALRAGFEQLDARLESLRSQVQDTRDSAELDRFRTEIDPLVDEWARVFQELVVFTLQAST